MFTRGRRLFTIASFATILVSALHTIGNLNTTPADTGEAAVQHLMRGYTIPLGMGMAPSVWDILRSLVFTMTVTLLALGALGLVLAADRQVGARVLRRVALVLAITSAGLMTLFFLYRIPPPLVSFVVVTLLYAAAVVTTKERPQ
jgi:hypothetical protein